MIDFQVPGTCIDPDFLTTLSMAQLMGNVNDTSKTDGTKDAADTEEASKTGVENRVNMGPPGNFVSKNKVGETNQTNKEQFQKE